MDLGWLYGVDLWVPQSDVKIAASTLLTVAALFLRGCQTLSGRLVVIFVFTALVELAMNSTCYSSRYRKTARGWRTAPRLSSPASLILPERPYSLGRYPFLGALYLLLENRVVRARIVLALCGMAAGRTYMGHWT